MSIPGDRIEELLGMMYRMAETGSMAGSLKGGVPIMITVFNKCHDLAAKEHPGLADLIPSLAPDADVDQVGVAAGLLLAYLRGSPERLFRLDE